MNAPTCVFGDAVRTRELVQYASVGILPDRGDPTKDFTPQVTCGEATNNAPVLGAVVTGATGESTNYEPSAKLDRATQSPSPRSDGRQVKKGRR